MKDIIVNNFHKIAFKFNKHKPEILAVVGAGLTIGGTVAACKATIKANDILEDTKRNVEAIHVCLESEHYADQYSEEDAKKDLVITYTQTGVKLAKQYAPAAIMIGLGLGCLFTSNNILRKRNVALGAAYATLDKGYKKYRENVVERFGNEVDRELRYNLKAQKVTDKVIDEETGKEKKVKRTQYVPNNLDTTEYDRYFSSAYTDENGSKFINVSWNDNNEYNLAFIRNVEKWANRRLRGRGYLFLNEVYEKLGIPECREGHDIGWVYNKPIHENKISFGYGDDPDALANYIYNNGEDILLTFNVDGIVWDLL